MICKYISVLLAALSFTSKVASGKPPHIVMIVIDDIGWNDVPWNNPDSFAVNLGYYARQGVVLDRHYVHTKCSPSRAALLTGRLAWKLGVQRGAIERYQATGLSTNFTLLPERLKEAGYATHAVGKWHLGYCNEKYFPTRRGFDTFFGILQQAVNYRNRVIPCASFSFRKDMIGYDLRRNESVSYDYKGVYSPEMYQLEAKKIISEHNPDQPLFLYLPFMALHTPYQGIIPRRYQNMFNYGGEASRRVKNKNKDYDYEARDMGFNNDSDRKDIILAILDNAIDKVIKSLKKSGLYDNSIILVTTDNGAGREADNSPLRGGKETLYEGGIRGASFVLSPLLKNPGSTYKGLIHLVDWYPSLLNLAGLKVEDDLDGLDVWEAINKNEPEPRKTLIHNIDQDDRRGIYQSCIQSGKYKLIWGQDHLLKKSMPYDREKVQLFDIEKDPSERNDLSRSKPEVVEKLKAMVLEAKSSMVPADYPEGTKDGWPGNWDGIVSPGWC